MDYNHIKNYLDKVKNIIFSKEENSKIILNIIKINTSIELETKNISIRGATIYIKASPIIRNEIMIKKLKILSDISIAINGTTYKDIK